MKDKLKEKYKELTDDYLTYLEGKKISCWGKSKRELAKLIILNEKSSLKTN